VEATANELPMLTGGCIDVIIIVVGRSPVVKTVRKVDASVEKDVTGKGVIVPFNMAFCLAAFWAFSRAAISSSCSGTIVNS
jgi:hypothetical protein